MASKAGIFARASKQACDYAVKRHGSSWSHGGPLQGATQRREEAEMHRMATAYAKQHNISMPARSSNSGSGSTKAGGRGATARGVAGVAAFGGLAAAVISWINASVDNKIPEQYKARARAVRRGSQAHVAAM
mmetsp:Transcript_27762/g.54282  ORF Transcript_27762/g.54282 Transcript_27762/m.54282 type:complete len:132 (+) Transcript_27762:167-562(+)|eukprot:CAMPEP_0173387590 /NCGR_PEP_ID=MMETSP1356-20130122/10071_1 /TAXON_ID=77927 ORGANISM="Hemiselmis virescens, Strain PCC157" /NCGR_SAMPLE_ID=MMETSP1356 /ASSEMBLY_ACC=CAM_ASM_000847 /LENGTH=131 /DNA_ID=CAMNT_0014344253 /DNA_START=142 /DNA_END=537 /DNA_ORIENTATION=-